MDYASNFACLPEVCYKCSNTLFALVKAGSAIEKVVSGESAGQRQLLSTSVIEVLW